VKEYLRATFDDPERVEEVQLYLETHDLPRSCADPNSDGCALLHLGEFRRQTQAADNDCYVQSY